MRDLLALLLVAAVVLAGIAGALRFFARTASPIEALRRWGGAAVRGDGVAEPLEVVVSRGGRLCTVAWLQPPGQEPTLLLGVACAARGEVAGAAVQDGVLVVRVTNPPPDTTHPERLDALLDQLVAMAEDAERGGIDEGED